MYAEIGTCMEEYAYVCKTKSNIFLPKKTNTFDKQIYKCMHKHCKIMQKKTENMEIHINVLTVHGFQKYNNSSKNWKKLRKQTIKNYANIWKSVEKTCNILNILILTISI